MTALSGEHVISIRDLSDADIALTLDTAASFEEVNERTIKKLPTLRGPAAPPARFKGRSISDVYHF